jgi:hypothetical protein
MSEQNKKSHFRARKDAIEVIERQIVWRRSPNRMMAVLVLIAGMIGFVVTATLLKCGVMSMALRYASGLVAGYLTLCLSLWFWVGSHPTNIAADESNTKFIGKPYKSSYRSSKWSDLTGIFNLDIGEGFFISIFILMLLGIVFWFISSAPTMMAELTLDSVVSLQVYHRIRQSERHRYLSTFWRVTWLPLLCMFILVVGGAWVLQHFVPDAHTLWQVIRKN